MGTTLSDEPIAEEPEDESVLGDTTGLETTAPVVSSEVEEDITSETPIHPIPSMQSALEESMLDTSKDTIEETSNTHAASFDAGARRRKLLSEGSDVEPSFMRWGPQNSVTKTSGRGFHPLWKLVAQLTFGVHLLYNHMAKSAEEVIQILKTHVEEVDAVLLRGKEDIEVPGKDIAERIKFLRVPMEHVEVFEVMLGDREFRASIMAGNERIEHVISRTRTGLKITLDEIEYGLEAITELRKYLKSLDLSRCDEANIGPVYKAMRENSEGWLLCLQDMQSLSKRLELLLKDLWDMTLDINRRAASVTAPKRHRRILSSRHASIIDSLSALTPQTTKHSQHLAPSSPSLHLFPPPLPRAQTPRSPLAVSRTTPSSPPAGQLPEAAKIQSHTHSVRHSLISKLAQRFLPQRKSWKRGSLERQGKTTPKSTHSTDKEPKNKERPISAPSAGPAPTRTISSLGPEKAHDTGKGVSEVMRRRTPVLTLALPSPTVTMSLDNTPSSTISEDAIVTSSRN